MKRRLIKKVERMTLVDKVCELQRDICEHERFLGDLLVMICRPTQDRQFIKHETKHCDYFEFVWEQVGKILTENEELKDKLSAQNLKEE